MRRNTRDHESAPLRAHFRRALTTKEIAILRSCSTRATITPTSFVNHYEHGSFKGDEDGWMDRYFDAFMYTANWAAIR